MKIITALENPKTNEKLKKETKFEIIGNDIQYQEGVIEILENSKKAGLDRVIFALGIRNIGSKAGKILAEKFKDIDNLSNASEETLTKIEDIGPIMAKSIVNFFSSTGAIDIIQKLRFAGVDLTYTRKNTDNRFEGMTFVLTGKLPTLTRDEASKMIEEEGGNVSSSVSKKTSIVLLGEDAGSKRDKAISLGIKIIDEEEYNKMIES